MEYTIQVGEGIFQVKTSGIAELSGFLAFIEAIVNHPQWTPGSRIFIDHTDLKVAPLTFGDVSRIADHCAQRAGAIGEARIAMLVADDLSYGMNRMWTSLVYKKLDHAGNIFKSRSEAWRWLTGPGPD